MVSDSPWIQPGDRMLVPCRGGPSMARAVFCPPPLEIEVSDGVYVLVDDGPPETWVYEFIERG
jgi:hypothetical protein